jgi:glutamate/tyrosine decarboxylase-like PLP-dependent enzyme/L-rhamnose mutarotase
MVQEETLDPENWDEFRKLSHKVLDDMITHLETVGEKTYTIPTDEQRAPIYQPLSRSGIGEEATYNEFKENILPLSVIQKSSRWWGFVMGSGTPYGMLTNMLTGAMNLNETHPLFISFDVNKQALNWLKEMLDYPLDSSGVFVTGGSEANFTGLAVARNAMAEIDMKEKGMQGVQRKMILYVSEEGHHCLERSVELLGFGKDALRWLPTDDQYKIRLDVLQKWINDDRSKGFYPFCVIGNAGTVNTGAFDDFNALADLAKREKMWLHVDGSFGAWVKISETHRHLADGMERADSLAVDLHKWMSMPYGIGFTLTRHPRKHLETFVYGHEAAYVKSVILDKPIDEMLGASQNMALRMSNEFLALKAYMLLRAYGSDKFARVVQGNIDQINHLADRIRGERDFEFAAPVESNIVCFRYKPAGLSVEQVDELNRRIFQTSFTFTKDNYLGISDTTIKGRYTLRACNVNHRTRSEDFDWLVANVKRLGDKILPDLLAKK